MSKRIQVGIVVGILILAILGTIFINNKKVNSGEVSIYKDGELIKSIDLNSVKDEQEIKIVDQNEFNTIKITKSGVKVIEASCHDKVCIKTGEIHDSLLPIACLPNNLIIKVEGVKHDEFDTKTY